MNIINLSVKFWIVNKLYIASLKISILYKNLSTHKIFVKYKEILNKNFQTKDKLNIINMILCYTIFYVVY